MRNRQGLILPPVSVFSGWRVPGSNLRKVRKKAKGKGKGKGGKGKAKGKGKSLATGKGSEDKLRSEKKGKGGGKARGGSGSVFFCFTCLLSAAALCARPQGQIQSSRWFQQVFEDNTESFRVTSLQY